MIKLKKNQQIGEGGYATVYRISPQRVVKVFHQELDKDRDKLIRDEIRGSKQMKAALPVLRVVDVITPWGHQTKGLVKQYIPHKVTHDELREFLKKNYKSRRTPWDTYKDNYGKDNKGNVYRIDTQTATAERWINW
jgi:hypothetical protein